MIGNMVQPTTVVQAGVLAPPTFSVCTREELLQAGMPLPMIQEQIHSINAGVGWSDYNLATNRYFADRDVVCICAKRASDERICGYVIVKFSLWKDGTIAEIPYIATSNQSHGIGTALFQKTVAEAKKKGCPMIAWNCRPRVIPFYEKVIETSRLKKIMQEVTGCYNNGDLRTFYLCGL
jgi:hypothetical protein